MIDLFYSSSSEAVFGRAKYFERQKNFTKALDHLNQGIVLFPKYPPAFVEKMKMHLALEDWDQAVVSAQRYNILNLITLSSKKNGTIFNLF